MQDNFQIGNDKINGQGFRTPRLVHPRAMRKPAPVAASSPAPGTTLAARPPAGQNRPSSIQRTVSIGEVTAATENAGQTQTIDAEKVAEKVYRLMQRDLLLERERASRQGR